jgi:N6-L-threonylcarbamoyladenine synthase
MKKEKVKILGIESSCDETAVSIVEVSSSDKGKILSNIVFSQIDQHSPFGGVVPEIASRSHVESLSPLIDQALNEATLKIQDIDGVAATSGPGLIGGLIVGLTTAKGIAVGLDIPLIGVNHLEGHALTPILTNDIYPPYILLLVS